MANSRLLKNAIADAKAVRETALANAKLALEEAFTPRLQSMLTQKLRAEAEMENDEENIEEELDSSGIGTSTANPNLTATTELGDTEKESGEPGSELEDYDKVKEITEEEDFNFDGGNEEPIDQPDEKDAEIAELKARLAELEGDETPDEFSMGNDEEIPTSEEDEMGMDIPAEDEDENDLEAIIKELEAQLGDEEPTEEPEMEEPAEELPMDDKDTQIAELKRKLKETLANGEEAGTDKGADPKVVVTNEQEETEDSEEIDLEEILREMESDLTDEKPEEVPADAEELEANLQEAYKTIRSLQRTINEVNLLNAKLLFANKLFRAHNMTNEQKVKVIETLDRTKSVREVKLVYSTLAENFKYTSIGKPVSKSITEGISSKVVKSTKPTVSKQVINENVQLADRFKKLAGIIK